MAYVQSAGTSIYYETWGDPGRPAILFAHGAGGNAAIWFHQVAHFQKDYFCIAFDHRLFARSPADPASLSIPQFAADALAILDAQGVGRAHLVCQSMGGYTGLRLTLDHPERVASLVMSCTPGGIPIRNPSTALRSLTTNSGSNTSGVLHTMAKKTWADTARVQLYQAINSFNTEFSWEYLGGLSRPEDVVTPERLATVTAPVLFISGAEDPLFPPATLEGFVPLFTNAASCRLEVVQDTGHSPYFERPDAFNELLQQFIEDSP